MSGRTIKAGLTDQYCEVKVWTTADGVPNTTLVFNTAALAIWYQIGNAAPVEVVVGGSPAPATMSAGGAHADWGIYHVAQGRYKIGLADAVVSAAANVTVWIVFTDCDSAPCEIDVVGYDKTAAAVGANTVAPATPANVTTSTSTIAALLPAALVGGRMDSSVGSNLDKTGYALSQTFPTNFATLGINVSGHVSQVTLVDTTTANTDMRGTNSAYTGTPPTAADVYTAFGDGANLTALATATGFSTHNAADVWAVTTRALTATGLDAISTWTVNVTGSLSGNVGGIAGTITTLDALDTAQDTQHGTTQDRLGYTIAALAGASSDAGTAAETYAITLGADTYTIDHSGLDSTGNRGTATLTKT